MDRRDFLKTMVITAVGGLVVELLAVDDQIISEVTKAEPSLPLTWRRYWADGCFHNGEVIEFIKGQRRANFYGSGMQGLRIVHGVDPVDDMVAVLVGSLSGSFWSNKPDDAARQLLPIEHWLIREIVQSVVKPTIVKPMVEEWGSAALGIDEVRHIIDYGGRRHNLLLVELLVQRNNHLVHVHGVQKCGLTTDGRLLVRTLLRPDELVMAEIDADVLRGHGFIVNPGRHRTEIIPAGRWEVRGWAIPLFGRWWNATK